MTQFPDIDYNYWSGKNEAYGKIELLPTIKGALTIIGREGTLSDIIQRQKMSNYDLVQLIKQEIQSVLAQKKLNHENGLLRIFDLIQCWGGITGRNPYVKPSNNTSRKNWRKWIDSYKTGIQYASNNNYYEGLKNFKSLPGVGISFGTKHLHFWSMFDPVGKEKNPLPIFDTRMKLLLYRSLNRISYDEFLNDMTAASARYGISLFDLEKALFAFSRNYFSNNKLEVIADNKDKTDYKEALKISQSV